MSLSLMEDINMIQKQYNDKEVALDGTLNTKEWIADECQIIIGADMNKNLNSDK